MVRAPSPAAACAAMVAAVAFAWAWWLSGPSAVMGINWDTASYVALYASGQGNWRQQPWNSHFGLGPLYELGSTLVRPWGGSFIDGVRLMNAAALASASAVLAASAFRLCQWMGGLWALVHATAFALASLLLTVEDNVLYLPFAAGLCALALLRLEAWRLRDSVFAGLLGAGGILVSWQAGLYLVGPLYVAALAPGPKEWRLRLRDAVTLLLAVFATLNLYVAAFAVVASATPVAELWRTLFSRPEPSFFPESPQALWQLLARPRGLVRHVGLGLAGAVGPEVARARVIEPALALIGSLALAGTLATAAWARFRARPRTAAAWAITAGLLLGTALYVDLPVDKHKRYDFVPLSLALVGIAWTAGRTWRPRRRHLVAGALAACIVAQIGVSIAAARAYRAGLPLRSPPGYYGRGHTPWYVVFRALRAAHPKACLFTLPLDAALAHGRYQLEIPAALWSELPAHLLVGAPEAVAEWPRKVNVVAPEHLPKPRPCEWRAPELLAPPLTP